MSQDRILEEAKQRMEAGRKAREKRRKQIKDIEEPDHLISGRFDEVELKRAEKHEEDNNE